MFHCSVVSLFHRSKVMTLARITERIQEEKDKLNKLDGRRFNVRSKKKMNWEMRDIAKTLRNGKRKNPPGLIMGLFTKEELEEYRKMDETLSNQKQKDEIKKDTSEDKSSCQV